MSRYLLYICIVVVASAFTPLFAATDKIAQQKSVIATLEKQVAEGEREVVALRENRAANEVKVKILATQVETRSRLLAAQRKEEQLLREEISMADKTTLILEQQIDQERVYYAQMVREAYRSYRSNNVLTYLFSANDFHDMARKVSNLRAVAELRATRIARVDSLSLRLSQERTQLLSRKSDLEKVVRDLESQKRSLESDVSSARLSISEMSAKEKSILQQNQLQQQKLESAVKELQKLIKGNQSGATFSAKTTNLQLPVQGGRVKQYKDNMAEIVGAVGAKVTSIYEGKIVDVRLNRITGKYDVYIAHGEYITSYAGLSEVSISKGYFISRSEVIGVIGEAIDIITMQSEYKIVFGVYPPTTKETISAANCFKK
ncbi:MAG: peptidoglycan DD-metalloendopeptidase family protein [Rikenellaceae bacterium]